MRSDTTLITVQNLPSNFFESECIVVYQGMQDSSAPKQNHRHQNQTLLYLWGSSAVQELGKGMSYPVLCLPSICT